MFGVEPVALLFDFDGVIVESYSLHRATWKEAFYNVFSKELPEYPREVTSGLSPIKIADFLAAEAGDSAKGKTLLKEKYRLVLEGNEYPPLYEGVLELMNQLDIHSIPYAIVSNAKKEYVQKVVEYYALPVVNIFGLEDFSKPKPDKEPYEKAALQLGIVPEQFLQVLVFEDSMPGIQSARAAGMVPVGVLTKHTNDEMLEAGVENSITCFAEINFYKKRIL